ncbi:hypothetical protein CR152_07320 [Massilia violaceinigra]|uniref:Uncharacterized protein n=1 Tax=Massilia violaceinigra TaxID=2045208 RepID=A0A2D2DH82_9BURK|nr:hypothetical protein [Massilia violaceinigra]ATQ74340.1 hypothetical protein CR152_07320 [Massilia violaceinigra]
MKNPHFTATVCFALAAVLFFAMPSKEYAAGFALLGMFFELSAWKKFLTRDRKNPPPPAAPD